MKKFIIGDYYNYNLLESWFENQEMDSCYWEESGVDFCGKHSVHIGNNETDVWFIYHSHSVNGGTYKCVYNE